MGTIKGSHVRFEVGVHAHYKLKRAGSLAACLWMRAIVYAGGQPNLDGRIPLDILPDLIPDVALGLHGERGPNGEWRVVTPMDVLHRAIHAGLFDPVVTSDIGEVAPVHDYLDYNLSGAERTAKSEARSRAAEVRHEKAPPTPRDTGSGRFTTSRANHEGHQGDRADATTSHGPHRAPRTEPTVPTTSSAVSLSASSAVSRPARERDSQWVPFGAEWEPMRQALAERGYRLPPVANSVVEGCPRTLLERLVDGGDHEAAARDIREAPAELRTPRPLADLVSRLFREGEPSTVSTEPTEGSSRKATPVVNGPVRVDALLGGVVTTVAASKDDPAEPA